MALHLVVEELYQIKPIPQPQMGNGVFWLHITIAGVLVCAR